MARTLSPLPAALVFLSAGTLHFARPQVFEGVVPDWAGDPHRAVLLSGVAELAGGLGLLLPSTRRAASLSLVALLIAVLPVHVLMVQHPERFQVFPRWALWLRLCLQPALIWWVWRTGKAG